MTNFKTENLKKFPEAVWPYSPYYEAGDFIFCSWQIAIDPNTNKLIKWSIKKQTEQVIQNIKALVNFLWLELTNIVKTTIFITDINKFATVNEIYWKYFLHKPARSTIEVSSLPLWASIEIEVIIKK